MGGAAAFKKWIFKNSFLNIHFLKVQAILKSPVSEMRYIAFHPPPLQTPTTKPTNLKDSILLSVIHILYCKIKIR